MKSSTYTQRPDLKWLSIDRVKKRLEDLKHITTNYEDDETINEVSITSWEKVIENAKEKVEACPEGETVADTDTDHGLSADGTRRPQPTNHRADLEQERKILEKFKEWTQYKPREMNKLLADIWGVLSISGAIRKPCDRAWEETRHSVLCYRPFAFMKFVILIYFAIIDWTSTFFQICLVPVMIFVSMWGLIFM